MKKNTYLCKTKQTANAKRKTTYNRTPPQQPWQYDIPSLRAKAEELGLTFDHNLCRNDWVAVSFVNCRKECVEGYPIFNK